MYTKELLPILKEFKGKKSLIKLMNGETISGAIGDLHNTNPFQQNEYPNVSVLDDANNKTIVYLSNINALRLA
jgi:hypothetical protein